MPLYAFIYAHNLPDCVKKTEQANSMDYINYENDPKSQKKKNNSYEITKAPNPPVVGR
jgi:hypothetical protein